ncbi:asymmetrical bis(5'-nucleosyl)-tetraphosphatase [Cenarchaeum symbiosum A]|uniref:Asymmetrical bis(5'-nucleosyl)-tetraphosphatase n=1 Tax=Cenarchaeum symbiosum (strain A) TaxID=414004 RepID=A0RX45_CENSY|nr:asymmetrical bis(5'-nucleosyl)-tetraphosphatase [Cenarchaeum symbiosum A]
MKNCIFCEIIRGGRRGAFVYRDGGAIAILDKYPIDLGHCLVIPREHHETIGEMDPRAVGDLFSRVPKIARAVVAGTGADAFSIAQNNGRAARQIVPHVHIHIIPRFNGRTTEWTSRTIPEDDELEQLAGEIRGHLPGPDQT